MRNAHENYFLSTPPSFVPLLKWLSASLARKFSTVARCRRRTVVWVRCYAGAPPFGRFGFVGVWVETKVLIGVQIKSIKQKRRCFEQLK